MISSHHLAQHDTHVHSTYSTDGRSNIHQIAEWGRHKLDCDALWITDHLEFAPQDQDFGVFNYEKIVEEIKQISRAFPKPSLFLGVEVDFQSRFLEQIEEFLSSYEFDFVIGAVHYVNGRIDKEFYMKYGHRAYDAYFAECLAAVNSGLIDSLGHFNRPAGINPAVEFNRLEKMQAVLEALLNEGVALELNTRHFERSDMLEIMRMYTGIGGKMVTLGSDAHHASNIMLNFRKARALLARSSIEDLVIFADRKAYSIPIC
ncbi:MAG: histidinol-phosphatase HisJ family protein [Candidatus Heimdallarchaeota archaeon]